MAVRYRSNAMPRRAKLLWLSALVAIALGTSFAFTVAKYAGENRELKPIPLLRFSAAESGPPPRGLCVGSSEDCDRGPAYFLKKEYVEKLKSSSILLDGPGRIIRSAPENIYLTMYPAGWTESGNPRSNPEREVEKGEIKVTPQMSAEIVAGAGINVSPSGPKKVAYSDYAPVTWNWIISADKAGMSQPFSVNLYAHDLNNEMVAIAVYEGSLDVEVTPLQVAKDYVELLHPVWLFFITVTPTLLAVVAWFRKTWPFRQAGSKRSVRE